MSHASDQHTPDHHGAHRPPTDNQCAAPAAPALRLASDADVGSDAGRRTNRRRTVVDRRTGVDRRGVPASASAGPRPRPHPTTPQPPVHAEPADAAALEAAVNAPDDEAAGPIYGPRTIALPGESEHAPMSAPGGSGLERRRGAGRRLSDFTRAAEEGELTPEQFLFVMAIQEFKRANAVSFPAWTDVLEVIRLLGYRKTQASQLNLRNAEDWREQADAAANVRPKGWEKRAA